MPTRWVAIVLVCWAFWPGGLRLAPALAAEGPSASLADAPAVEARADRSALGATSGWNDLVRGLLQPRGARAAFQRLQGLGREALPAVRAMLRGRNLRLVRAALDLADSLGEELGDRLDQAGELGQGLTQDLRAIVTDRRLGGLRRRAARLLGRVGGPLEQVLPALSAALRDPDLRLRLAAADSLLAWWARREGLWPEIRAMLRQPGHPVRVVLAEVLGRLGPAAHPLWPLVAAWLRTGRLDPAAVVTHLLPVYLPRARELGRLALQAWERSPGLANCPAVLGRSALPAALAEVVAGLAAPASRAVTATVASFSATVNPEARGVASPVASLVGPPSSDTAAGTAGPVTIIASPSPVVAGLGLASAAESATSDLDDGASDLADTEAEPADDPAAASALAAAAAQGDQAEAALSFEDVPASEPDL
ncbi:MAG: hypothetical protein OZSIB_2417 [Candidatus Ozemobacter sibiricus]|jgi:hypothetical protein|uniref:HEAT repeat domain-containing protein n=1 Tax=Candidatus Ozemobacter sibiricus TaxID=2268124 RepID=A0A367ZSM5_9BACT|nr:MAG: hypothetical protein OZSIB_2417 [Candidatus Ozemobacter sibiricus]